MIAADKSLEPKSPSRRRVIAMVLLIGFVSGILSVLLPVLVAQVFHVPSDEVKNAMLTLIGATSITAVTVLRLRGYVRRGRLVADAGGEPRRKLFLGLAAISLVGGVVIVEAARREAEIAPVHSRIQQLLALRQPILDSTQKLLDRQRVLLADVPPDLKGAQELGQSIRQQQAESNGLGSMIAFDIAEEHRLTYRLLPEWNEVAQSLKDLCRALSEMPSDPWTILASTNTLQLYLAVFAFANGLLMLQLAIGHRQIRENGIWHGGMLVPWKLIGSHRWENDNLIAVIGKTQTSITLDITPFDKPAVEEVLLREARGQ